MTNPSLLKFRLPILFLLLGALETCNLFKLSVAMSWTNGGALGILAAVTLGAFFIGSILALSFELEQSLKTKLERMVILLFGIQMALVCIVSFLHSLTLMPADQIAMLFGTPVEATRRVVALAEGASLNIATVSYWSVMGSIWQKELQQRHTQLEKLANLDKMLDGNRSRS